MRYYRFFDSRYRIWMLQYVILFVVVSDAMTMRSFSCLNLAVLHLLCGRLRVTIVHQNPGTAQERQCSRPSLRPKPYRTSKALSTRFLVSPYTELRTTTASCVLPHAGSSTLIPRSIQSDTYIWTNDATQRETPTKWHYLIVPSVSWLQTIAVPIVLVVS